MQVIRQKLSDENASAPLSGNGLGPIEFRLRLRRADQFFNRDLQRGGHFGQRRDRRIGGARFQIRPGRPRRSRKPRELFLGQITTLSQLPDVLRNVACDRIINLINNASALGPVPLRLIADTDCEDFERALEVNVVGPLRLTKAVVGSMMARKTGVIVNVSSDAAVEAYPYWGAYGASKAALDHLTRIAAAEMSDIGARFLSVDPGEMDTRMRADAMPDADPSGLQSPETIAEKIVAMIRESGRIVNGSRLIAPEWRSL